MSTILQPLNMNDISPDWNGATEWDDKIIRGVLARESSPHAVRYFAANCNKLSDYWYWFMLSTMWVSYSAYSDIKLWKRLFSADRPNRDTSIMKPSEKLTFDLMPDVLSVYRAHRTNEADWIAYTLSPKIAGEMAYRREVAEVYQYVAKKSDCLAYFGRRGEYEVLVIDKNMCQFSQVIPVRLSYTEPTHVRNIALTHHKEKWDAEPT